MNAVNAVLWRDPLTNHGNEFPVGTSTCAGEVVHLHEILPPSPDAGDASEQNGSLSTGASCLARSPMQIRLARSVRPPPSVRLSVCCYLCGVGELQIKRLSH